MAKMPFGRLADGREIDQAVIEADGLKVNVIGLGAAIREIQFQTRDGWRPMTLGLETLDDYVNHSPSMGIVAGRYANRIAHGRFPLEGRIIEVVRNQDGVHHLHGGGATGFGKIPWTIVDSDARSVTLTLHSPDGDQGYPGAVDVRAVYRIDGPGVLTIDLTATTTRTTIINLATHAYFNLDGSPDILDHLVEIAADHYCPKGEGSIPTGEIAPVTGTPNDFRKPRAVREVSQGLTTAYDYGFFVGRTRLDHPRHMASVESPKNGVKLEVLSTEPNVHFYDGYGVNVPVPGLHGRTCGPRSGLCLEPQYPPDTPNKPQFGDVTLRPGETYHQVTQYRFTQG